MFPQDGELSCRRCQTRTQLEGPAMVVVKQSPSESKGILVIEEDEETLPKTKAECPQCGNNEAFWVLRQMRGADEPETRIYRCTKCKNTWREN